MRGNQKRKEEERRENRKVEKKGRNDKTIISRQRTKGGIKNLTRRNEKRKETRLREGNETLKDRRAENKEKKTNNLEDKGKDNERK